jgi:hypothetical protein
VTEFFMNKFVKTREVAEARAVSDVLNFIEGKFPEYFGIYGCGPESFSEFENDFGSRNFGIFTGRVARVKSRSNYRVVASFLKHLMIERGLGKTENNEIVWESFIGGFVSERREAKCYFLFK